MPDLQEFHDHVKRGDLEAVRSALAEDPALLEATNSAGQAAFLLAKYYRQEPTAEYLLSLSPRMDVFSLCVAGRSEAVLEEVVRNRQLLGSHSSDGWTPLHLAAFFGHRPLAAALLQEGAAIDARSTNGLNNTPLHAAAAGGFTELVVLLLERGADANARQHGGWTALHSAAQAGNLPMAEALLASSADREARADNNQTPLDLALSRGHAEMAALLERPLPPASVQ